VLTLVITDATLVGTVPRRADQTEPFAPGWPGLPARWTSSAKSGVGTSVSRDSRVWFTPCHGIVNEVYYPRVDHACSPDPNVPFLHDPAETGMDPAYAARTATRMYRTMPLRGLQQHPPYFHDGSAPIFWRSSIITTGTSG
jgi:hypothetical protein